MRGDQGPKDDSDDITHTIKIDILTFDGAYDPHLFTLGKSQFLKEKFSSCEIVADDIPKAPIDILLILVGDGPKTYLLRKFINRLCLKIRIINL